MANQNDIKQKKQLLEHQYIGRLITDVLMEADLLTHSELQGTELEYAQVAVKIMSKLRGVYGKALKKEVRIVQKDLETEIKELKYEKRTKE